MNKRQLKKKSLSIFPWKRSKSGRKISSIELKTDGIYYYPLWVKFKGLEAVYTYTKDGYYVDKDNFSSLDLVRK